MSTSATPRSAASPAPPPPSANGKRYLLVLDMDILAADEQLGLEPINYLVAQQEVAQQEQEPCEVVVLSLVSTRQTRMPAMELLLGANRGVFPRAPRPDHDVSDAAEQRLNLAVQHVQQTTGCEANGLISDNDLVEAVHAETRAHHYDKVILVTGREDGGWSARAHLDPVHQLRRRLGQRLIIFPPGPGTPDARS
jgi:hypothetical protein